MTQLKDSPNGCNILGAHKDSIFPCESCGKIIHVNAVWFNRLPENFIEVNRENEGYANSKGQSVCYDCYEEKSGVNAWEIGGNS